MAALIHSYAGSTIWLQNWRTNPSCVARRRVPRLRALAWRGDVAIRVAWILRCFALG